jgi:hypothetical protein
VDGKYRLERRLAVVEVARDSLIFSNGLRYELGGTARATVESQALASNSGPVRLLETVPPLPPLSPIAESARLGRVPLPSASAARSSRIFIRTQVRQRSPTAQCCGSSRSAMPAATAWTYKPRAVPA